jgi:hypothetical protein
LLMAVFSLLSVFSWVVPKLVSVTGSLYNVNLELFRYSLKLSMPQAAAAVSSRN